MDNLSEKFNANEGAELSTEQAEAIMTETISKGLEKKELPRFASLGLLLDRDGKPVLTERKTPPHEGLFSVVGGKIDQAQKDRDTIFPKPNSTLSSKLISQGFENATYAMVREAAEELYFGSVGHQIWDYLSRLHETGNTAELENLFLPKRHAIIFDRANNSYCALFTITQPEGLKLNPKSREIGQIKKLSDLLPEQINPLTSWFLKRLGYADLSLPNIQTGPIKHIYYPDDIYKHVQQGKALEPSSLDEPGWLLSY